MKIILENSDVRELMLDSFINGGLNELYHCDCMIDWENEDNNLNYDKSREICKKEIEEETFKDKYKLGLCQEDILIKMLEEFGIIFKDECYEDGIVLTFDMAKANLQKMLDEDTNGWFANEVGKVIPEYDDADAYTYCNILQGALFSEVIYG